jgi:hypothetical protein
MNKEYSLYDFLPLIFLFLIITISSLIRPIVMHSFNIHSFMYDFMGIFFIIFGGFKIYNSKEFAQAYAEYDLIAKRSKAYAYFYPYIELGLGICYLMRWQLKMVNGITMGLMLVSAAGVAYALSKKEQITCACLGMVFKIPMTYVTFFEDMLMAGMAAMMLLLA